MGWEIPKVNWVAADNPGAGGFNRIEKNIAWLKQANIKIPTDGSSFTVELPEGAVSATVTVMVWMDVTVTSGSGEGATGYGYISIGSVVSNHVTAMTPDEYSSATTKSWAAVTTTVTGDFTVVFGVGSASDTQITAICPIAQVYFL